MKYQPKFKIIFTNKFGNDIGDLIQYKLFDSNCYKRSGKPANITFNNYGNYNNNNKHDRNDNNTNIYNVSNNNADYKNYGRYENNTEKRKCKQ